MSEEQPETLSLKAAYAFGAANGLDREINDIRNMIIEWDVSYTSSLRRGYVVALFETHGLFEQFKEQHWTFGNTPGGSAKRRRYLRIKTQYEEFLSGRAPEPTGGVDADSAAEREETLEFALEAHLRDFLARNLERIEPGLRLYETAERKGIEYPVEGGRIDLLALDRRDNYVVIELKLSQGRNKTLGQLLYYMGWVDQHLGESPCRVYIIASEITEDLSVAVSRVPGVNLAKYRMSFAIEPVAQPNKPEP
jgi:hypothetical protein